jgi:hypothetical protein
VGVGAQKLDSIESHPARLREDAQQPDMTAAEAKWAERAPAERHGPE